MKSSRRNFIKTGLKAGFASLFIPAFLKADSLTLPGYSLNYKPDPAEWKNDEVTLAWIGHSTVLLNYFGKWILTDPVFSERVGIYFFGTNIGPSRVTPPALTIDELPKPDIILLSHAHMDHMDYPSLRTLSNRYPGEIEVITAYLTSDVIEDLPWKSLTIMDWNDTRSVCGIEFRALEVKHFGWRFPWERDRSRGYMKDGRSFNAYLMNFGGRKILFGGDTAMTDKFSAIKNEKPDIAIMPIGAYNPWSRNHCNPEEALSMADSIGSKYFIPIHTKTFQQGREPFSEPIDRLKKAVAEHKLKLGLDEIGQTFRLS